MARNDRRLVINEIAQEDYLVILRESVRRWGRDQAAQYKGALDSSMERLLEFPELGPTVDDLFDGGRRLIVRRHIIYYTFNDASVVIHRILHERRHVTGVLFVQDPDDWL